MSCCKVLAYPDVRFSYEFISVIACQHCGGTSRLTRMLRDVEPVRERLAEVRLFECERCAGHTVLEVSRG